MLSTIQNIPRVMRSRGWHNGARLMDIWFSRPATTPGTYSAPDTTTIRMDTWLLTFPRARAVYDQLVRERIWANGPGQRAVATMLRRKGLLTPAGGAFGRLADPVPVQDPDYINQRPVSNEREFDDMTAALANYNLRVLVAGSVTPAPPGGPGGVAGPARYRVQITEVGIYMRDSYDFEGFQYLGSWSDRPDAFSPVPPPPVLVVPAPLPIPIPMPGPTCPYLIQPFVSGEPLTHTAATFWCSPI